MTLARTWKSRRRVAILRELASLGISNGLAAELCQCSNALISQYGMRYRISFSRKKREETTYYRILRENWASRPKEEIVELLHLAGYPRASLNSVSVIACKIGLRSPRSRSCIVPPELLADYRILRRYNYTILEAYIALGLLPRHES